MDSTRRRWSAERVVVLTALALGIAGGTYGVASAATGSSSGSGQSSSALPIASQSASQQGSPWGRQRSDETPLTGDALDKVTALAKAKVPGGTIVRVETDADGHAAYEAHLVRSDGTPVTVYVNQQFEVVSVESGMPGPPRGQAPPSSSSSSAGA
jgi:hypothetical protein